MLAQYYLLKLKLEFYVSPIKNIFARCPKPPTCLTLVNVADYVAWDVDYIINTLEIETSWRAPCAPKLPMRFDCMLEDGLLNHTYKCATGLTVHGFISNNLIRAGIRTKDDLVSTIKHYDELIKQRVKDTLTHLGLR